MRMSYPAFYCVHGVEGEAGAPTVSVQVFKFGMWPREMIGRRFGIVCEPRLFMR